MSAHCHPTVVQFAQFSCNIVKNNYYENLIHCVHVLLYADTKYDPERDLERRRKEKKKKIKEYHDALKKKKQKKS